MGLSVIVKSKYFNSLNLKLASLVSLGLFTFWIPSVHAKGTRVDLIGLILNRVFSSIGRPHLEFRLDFRFGSKKTEIQEFNGRFEIPFTQAIQTIPLVQTKKSDGASDLSPILPYLDLDTEGMTVQWIVDTSSKGGHQLLSHDIRFLNRQRQFIPLIVTTRSELTDFLQISIDRVHFEFSGMDSDPGRVTVDGNCDATQYLVDFKSSRIGDIPITCSLHGFVSKDRETYDFNFIYDSRNKKG